MCLLDTDVATSVNPMHLDDPDLASLLSQGFGESQSSPPTETTLVGLSTATSNSRRL